MTNFKALKEGDILSETQYYTVVKKVGDKVQLVNDYKENIVVNSEYVEKCLTSAVEVLEEKKITKTEAAALFIANPYTAITANYNKQVKEADVIKELMAVYEDSTPKTMGDAVKKAVKRALNGEERTIVGRHFGVADGFGRVSFVDMELDAGDNPAHDARLRFVDPRTLNWLIIKGIKYIVK